MQIEVSYLRFYGHSDNSEFSEIVLRLSFLAQYLKTITRNFSESTKVFKSENIVQVCLVSFKTHRVNKNFRNSVKDALSEFRVIVFWYREINFNSELGIFLQSMIFLEFEHS